jgi:hypothetical protein
VSIRSFSRRAAGRVHAWIRRVILARLSIGDAWERWEYGVPPTAFGRGSRHDFAWYFEGESAARVSSIGDIQDWLLGCDYANDATLFHEPDFWQHPCTFEKLRRGDCEDHAIWAWRKLVELGINADLVSGTVLRNNGERGAHVWVVLRDAGGMSVLECVAKSRELMLRPLAEVRGVYRPEFGVDRARRPYVFNGALLAMRERDRAPAGHMIGAGA